ncbi:hypothetical protein Tco_1241262 [Tanacetum coccineum]
MLNPSPDTCIDFIFNLNTESTSLVDVPVTTIAETPLSSASTLLPLPIPLITHLQQTPVPTPTTVPSSSLQDLPNFGSLFGFDYRPKTLENDFSEFKQINQLPVAVFSIPGIVDTYLANKLNEAVKTVVQLQSDRLRNEAQADNEDFINKLDDNINKIIKEQVKEQVKAQVSKILPKIKKTVNEQLQAEVLTRSSNESNTSHDVAANLSELELKKILIDKMESNKSIYRYDEQKNLCKALVNAYKSDKLILETYGDTVSFKRRRDDEDKDEEPSARSNRGSKRRRAGKEPESTSAPKEKTSKTIGKSIEGSLARKEDTHDSFNELMDTPIDFSAFNNPKGQQYPHDLRKPLPLIPNSQGRRVIPFDHFINNNLEYLRGGTSSQTYATSVTKTKAADYRDAKWIEDLVSKTLESAHDVYSRHKIIVVTKLQIVEWHNYKHLDWITVRRNDYKLSIVIQRRMEDLPLGVESYKKKLNLTRSDTYRLDLKQLPTYSAYLNTRGFIYQNKDKKHKLMRIDELYKFSDGTLNDVRIALDDILKRIGMKYLL